MVVTASVVMDVSPFLKWTLAIIAGGGVAAIMQGVTVTVRAKSSVLTAGTGNVLVSPVELAGSMITALLAIIAPIPCLILIASLCIFVMWKAGRLFFRRMKIK